MPSESLRIDEAAAYLGVCRRTIYYWIAQGRLQTVPARTGAPRVLVASLNDRKRVPSADRLAVAS